MNNDKLKMCIRDSLGTGCGIIPMIMQRVKPPKVIFALDIQKKAVEQLKMSIEKSGVETIVPVNADLKELWEGAPLGKCSLVTCNPPYKAADSGIESELDAHRIARHEIDVYKRQAISLSISLRLSPKPGALTAAHLKVPLRLLSISVVSASPSISSAMITSFLPD